MRPAILGTLLILLAGCSEQTLAPTAPPPSRPRLDATYTSPTAYRIMLSSDALAASVPVGGALFGPRIFGSPDFTLEGTVVRALDPADTHGTSTFDACSPLTNPGAIAGNIALVDRGTCAFAAKVKNAQDAGAIGVVVRDNRAEGIVTMAASGVPDIDAAITIPAVIMTQADGTTLLQAVNYRSVAVRIYLEPTTAPTVTVPDDIVVETADANGTVVNYSASATVGGVSAPGANCNPRSGSTFPVGTTTVYCIVGDVWQNTTTGQFKVTVLMAEAPVVQVPAPIVAELTGPGTNVTFNVSATDNVGVVSGPTCDHPSGSAFPLGATVVTCTAQDAAGNIGSATFTVTIVDTTKPVLTVPASVVVNATSPAGATVPYTASATDLSGVATLACAPASGSVFAIGSAQVTCTATDASNNVATATFTVSVKGAAAQVTDLQQAVGGLDIQDGIETSVQAKLSSALDALTSANLPSACGSLGALTNQLNAQAGKKLTVPDAQSLIAIVERIRTVAGC